MPGADPAEYAIRLGLWLAARQQNPYRDNTTLVACAPLDRSTSAYTIAESDVEAALARNAELEAKNARMREQRTQQQRMAYRTGWDDRGEAIASAIGCGGFMEAERRAKGYTDWLAGLLERHANEKSAQQSETFAEECDCDCQPGQPCLCPERDCYCGPCRVCGESPQQSSRDTADGGAEMDAIWAHAISRHAHRKLTGGDADHG